MAMCSLLMAPPLLKAQIQAQRAASPPSPAAVEPILTLEEKVWLGHENDIQNYEADTARLIQADPHSAFGHYLLAELYLRQFNQNPTQLRLLQQASELGQQAIELSPEQDFGYLIAAQVLDLMGYADNAVAILDGDGQVKLKASWRRDFLKAQLLSSQKSERLADKSFAASLSSKDASFNIIVPALISHLQANSQSKQLIAELKDWNSRFPHRLFDLSLALAYTDSKQFEAAHAIYKRLQKSNPQFLDAFINDAIIMYSDLGKVAEAEQMFRHLLTNSMLKGVGSTLIKAHLANLYLDQKKHYPDAQRFFLEAISASDNSMEWISFSHKAYEKHQRLQDFVAVLGQLRTKIPATGYIFALEGEVLSENLAEHDKAIESYRSAIILDPERSEFYNGLGLTYYRMNRFTEALNNFLEAVRVDPQDATSRYNQACVLSILGRPDEALGSLKEAIGLDPRLQQAARSDKDFVNLREMQGFRFLTEPRSSAFAAPAP